MTETVTPKPRTPRGPEKPETTFAKVVAKMSKATPEFKEAFAETMRSSVTAFGLRDRAERKLAAAQIAFDNEETQVGAINDAAAILDQIEKLTPEFRAAVLAMLEAK